MPLRLTATVLVLLVLTGCSTGSFHTIFAGRVRTAQELVGRYKVSNEEGYAILTLLPDGTHVQVIHFNDHRPERTASGTWSFDPDTQILCVRDSFAVSHDVLARKVDVACGDVFKRFGTVIWPIDPDWDIEYKKLPAVTAKKENEAK